MENDCEEKQVKVNCSFCGSEMECPESMLEKSKKHMCYECFMTKNPSDEEIKDINVDIPLENIPDFTASGMSDNMIDELFPSIWSDRKNELKEMSKKDIAEEMFGLGVYLGVKAFMEGMKRAEEDGFWDDDDDDDEADGGDDDSEYDGLEEAVDGKEEEQIESK